MESRIETIDQSKHSFIDNQSKHRERLDTEKSHSSLITTTSQQPIANHQRELEIKFQKLTELMIQTLRVSIFESDRKWTVLGERLKVNGP